VDGDQEVNNFVLCTPERPMAVGWYWYLKTATPCRANHYDRQMSWQRAWYHLSFGRGRSPLIPARGFIQYADVL